MEDQDTKDPLAEHPDLTARLAEALGEASPHRLPATLRGRVLAAVESEGTARRWDLAGWVTPSRLATLAAAVIAIASLGWGLALNQALAEERTLRAQLADAMVGQETVLEVVDSSTTVKAQLRAQLSGSTAYGKLYTRPDLSSVVAMAGRLPPAPAGQEYFLWLTDQSGATVLAGMFAPSDTGFGLVIYDAGTKGPVYRGARLILEPSGSAAPAGQPTLLWESGR